MRERVRGARVRKQTLRSGRCGRFARESYTCSDKVAGPVLLAEPGSDAGESYPANPRKFTFAIHNVRLFFACLFLCLFVSLSGLDMLRSPFFYETLAIRMITLGQLWHPLRGEVNVCKCVRLLPRECTFNKRVDAGNIFCHSVHNIE